ncbi:hypothetical protein LPJ56_000519 [Coemansia sp. RSA 2599]|nr:hypothetical protein LPJ75_000207 [Coemansia sp. RSA 2598]KAJ1829218.1 hypothetical protein LPJ56_000519 [Coemansia sp. RSA 2599]
MTVAENILFVDGELSSQVEELGRYVATLRQQGEEGAALDVDAFVQELGGSAEAVLKASLQGVLARAPEDKLEAVYNQLFAIVGQDKERLGASTGAVVADLVENFESGVGALKVLNNLYNVLVALEVAGEARAVVFGGMVKVAKKAGALGTLVPLVPRLGSMFGEWGVGADTKERVLVELRQAFDDGQLANEAYECEVVFLETLGAQSGRSAEVAASAIVRFANLPAVCDIDALASIPGVQELSKQGALGAAGELLDALLASDYKQWKRAVEEKRPALAQLGVDVDRAGDKVRLLTVASLAAASLGQDVPFAAVAEAIEVDDDEVEMWIIDVIRAGLIQGKMNQVSRTLLPTRSTYRSFGADQWQLLKLRLRQWKQSLETLQPVIANAKIVAQQQAMQMAGQSRVTIKELFRREALLVERRAQTARLRAALELSQRLEQQIGERRLRIRRKQQQVSQRAYLVEQLSTLVDQRAARHGGQRQAMQEAETEARAVALAVGRQAVALRQERIILEDLRAMLAKERAEKMRRLMEVFDVGVMDDGAWCVCGLRADLLSSGAGGEEGAAALGLVCRALDLVARYLAVPLRFPVVPRGSRSALCMVGGSGAVELLPLFAVGRGGRADRFVVARRALATDVDQLLWAHGLDGHRQLLLPGLLQLLMAIESSSFA